MDDLEEARRAARSRIQLGRYFHDFYTNLGEYLQADGERRRRNRRKIAIHAGVAFFLHDRCGDYTRHYFKHVPVSPDEARATLYAACLSMMQESKPKELEQVFPSSAAGCDDMQEWLDQTDNVQVRAFLNMRHDIEKEAQDAERRRLATLRKRQ